MGVRFSDVIEAAIRAARARSAAQDPPPVRAEDDEVTIVEVEAEAETTDVVPPPHDAEALDRTP